MACSNVARVLLGIGMLLLVLWLGLLAGVDILATRHHFAGLRSGYLVEQAELEIETRRLRNLGGNGKPVSTTPASGRRKARRRRSEGCRVSAVVGCRWPVVSVEQRHRTACGG